MLEDVKLALRIRTNAFDSEILDLIEQAKNDMTNTGIKNIDEGDPAIKRAIVTFAKANFGLQNDDSEKYQDSYNLQVIKLSLCGDYNVE